MEVKVFEPSNVKRTVLLKLKESFHGVELVVVNESGMEVRNGILLRINPSGTIVLLPGVNPELGLPLEGDGRVKQYQQ